MQNIFKIIYILSASNILNVIDDAMSDITKNRINFCELITMGKNDNKSVVNVKIDNDVKSKLETLAFIRKQTIQELCENIFIKEIEAFADKIEQVEKLRE